ncbi:11062_t:CDS:2, partial [Paraglomus occultum]
SSSTHTVRKQGEEKLQKLLSTIKEANNSKNIRKAKRLNTFEAAHHVAGRRAACNTINTYTKIVLEDDEVILNSVRERGQAVSEPSRQSSKRLRSSETEMETETASDSDISWQSENENAKCRWESRQRTVQSNIVLVCRSGRNIPEDACQLFVNQVNVSAIFFEYHKLFIKKVSTDSMESAKAINNIFLLKDSGDPG